VAKPVITATINLPSTHGKKPRLYTWGCTEESWYFSVNKDTGENGGSNSVSQIVAYLKS